MGEHHADRVHPEAVVLDIGADVGALVICTRPALHGVEIEVRRRENGARPTHVQVLERRIRDEPVFAAVFPGLRAGDYDVLGTPVSPGDAVSVIGGRVATLDWR